MRAGQVFELDSDGTGVMPGPALRSAETATLRAWHGARSFHGADRPICLDGQVSARQSMRLFLVRLAGSGPGSPVRHGPATEPRGPFLRPVSPVGNASFHRPSSAIRCPGVAFHRPPLVPPQLCGVAPFARVCYLASLPPFPDGGTWGPGVLRQNHTMADRPKRPARASFRAHVATVAFSYVKRCGRLCSLGVGLLRFLYMGGGVSYARHSGTRQT